MPWYIGRRAENLNRLLKNGALGRDPALRGSGEYLQNL
jgi:hypothetical protein